VLSTVLYTFLYHFGIIKSLLTSLYFSSFKKNMKQKILVTLGILGAFVSPAVVLAERYIPISSNNQGILGTVGMIGTVVASLVPVVSTLAILFFFWGLAKYILAAGDPESKADGKKIMIWGIIAIFIMVTLFGIIGYLQSAVGTNIAPIVQDIKTPYVRPSFVDIDPTLMGHTN
jgi:hypothetical protein